MKLRSAFAKSPRPQPKKPRIVGRHALRERLILMVARGQVGPGEKLVQFRLARRFGVSISLIREALLDLQAYGLIESDDNRGFFVRELDAKAMIDFYAVREVLEGLAARTACAHITPAQVAELTRVIDDLCREEEAGNHRRRAELDRHFHDRINEISGNRSILSLTRQCSLFGKVLFWSEHPTTELRAIHVRILEAINQRQPDKAERLAREHVREGRFQVEAKLARGGEGINWLPLSATNSGARR